MLENWLKVVQLGNYFSGDSGWRVFYKWFRWESLFLQVIPLGEFVLQVIPLGEFILQVIPLGEFILQVIPVGELFTSGSS